MSPIDERVKSLNIVLPDVMPPVVDGYVPAFAPFTRSGDQIHLSGRLGKEGGKLLCGKVGEEISLDQAEATGLRNGVPMLLDGRLIAIDPSPVKNFGRAYRFIWETFG
jgi:hypothetical protein